MSSTRVDRDSCLADVAGHARMIGVIAAMRREIERDAQPLLPAPRGCGDRKRWTASAVEKPAYCRTVHGRPAYIDARTPRVNGAKPGRPGSIARVGGGVEWLDRRCPRACASVRSAPFTSFAAEALPIGKRQRLSRHRHYRTTPAKARVPSRDDRIVDSPGVASAGSLRRLGPGHSPGWQADEARSLPAFERGLCASARNARTAFG